MNDRGEPEIRQASAAAAVNKNVGLARGYLYGLIYMTERKYLPLLSPRVSYGLCGGS